MKVVAFIEPPQGDVIEKILQHCGLWQASSARAPPDMENLVLDLDFEFSDSPIESSDQPDSSAMQLRFLVGWAAFSRAAGFPSDRFATGSLRCSGYAWDQCC